VDVRVGLSRLAKHDRSERRHEDEHRDDRRDVERTLPRRERGARVVVAQRIGERQYAARDEERDVGAERKELP
jgi:hypothetical protein